MPRIRFYHNAGDRLAVAAAWLWQSWRQRQPVVVYTPNRALADRLDQMLWSQPATGFMPHCSGESSLAAETPVVLASNLDQLPHDQTLLNLGDETPPGFSRFENLIEIVSCDDNDRQAARLRFRHYRERGYAIDTNDLSAEPQAW